MSKKEALQLFESKKVRFVWDSDLEKWYISGWCHKCIEWLFP